MNTVVLLGGLEQGLIYSLVALGIYISYRTLDIADLTTDGSFALGAAVSAMLSVAGHPLLALLCACLCGALAGSVTALLQTKLGVQPILAGIITLTALYSINLMVMGNSPNVSLGKNETIFTLLSPILGGATKIIVSFFVVAIICVFIVMFFKTQLGLSVRATGDNRSMVAASSINPALTTTVGLCVSNAIVALSGALLAQYQRFASSDVGNGMVIIGLASLILGEVLFGKKGVCVGVCSSVIGSIVYRIALVIAMTSSFVSAQNLKLATAVLVALAISYPAIKSKIALYKKRKAAQNVKAK